MGEYSGLVCSGELGWVARKGIELISGPYIVYALIMSSFAKEKKKKKTDTAD